jgi:hypothetical protein
MYDGSVQKVLKGVYPDFEFVPWLHGNVPRRFWRNNDNRVEYLRWLVQKVGVKSEEELTSSHFREDGGSGLLALFNSSVAQVLNATLGLNSPRVRHPPGFWVSILKKSHYCELIISLG